MNEIRVRIDRAFDRSITEQDRNYILKDLAMDFVIRSMHAGDSSHRFVIEKEVKDIDENAFYENYYDVKLDGLK